MKVFDIPQSLGTGIFELPVSPYISNVSSKVLSLAFLALPERVHMRKASFYKVDKAVQTLCSRIKSKETSKLRT